MKNRYNSGLNSNGLSIHQIGYQNWSLQHQYNQQFQHQNQYQQQQQQQQQQQMINFHRPKYQPKSPPIIEIYDLEALELDNSSQLSSLSSSSSWSELNQYNSKIHKNYSTTSSQYSSSSSPRSSIESSSLYHSDAFSDEPLTFREFISSIITSNDKEWHKLIIQDLARLLELKFRDFKKSFSCINLTNNKSTINTNGGSSISSSQLIQSQHMLLQPSQRQQQQQQQQIHQNKNHVSNTTISLSSDSDLFTKIAEKIFELASEEPNGILGARIKLKLICDGGKIYDVSQSFPYDSSTMATSEIVITLKEDITSFKKFLQAFKLYSNIGKYFALHIDSNNFDISKIRLY